MRSFTRQSLRTECRDLIELVLIPSMAALLPWPICFRLFRLIAKSHWLYRQASQASLEQAKAKGLAVDERAWLWERRLVTLVDHADLYLSLTRSDRWMQKHLTVHGKWPAPGQPSLLCTFHWGAGMWALRHAAAAGLTPNALVASLDPAYFVNRRLLYRYAIARTKEVADVLQRATIDVNKNLKRVLTALKQGEPILAAIDAPADQAQASQHVTLLGMEARMPTALLRLALDKRTPVLVYTTALDLKTGQRILQIHTPEEEENLDALTARVFSKLDEAMHLDPGAWHFWSEAPRIFIGGEHSKTTS